MIRTETITKTTDFLNYVSGESLTNKELIIICKQFKLRSNLHLFANELRWAKKNKNKWEFINMKFDPIHSRQIIQLGNDYNKMLAEKRSLKFINNENKIEEEIFNNDELFEEHDLVNSYVNSYSDSMNTYSHPLLENINTPIKEFLNPIETINNNEELIKKLKSKISLLESLLIEYMKK